MGAQKLLRGHDGSAEAGSTKSGAHILTAILGLITYVAYMRLVATRSAAAR